MTGPTMFPAFAASAAPLPRALARALAAADLGPLALGRRIAFAQALGPSFVVDPTAGVLWLGPAALSSEAGPRLTVRHGLELSFALELCPSDPVLAGLMAARTAALFALLELDADSLRALGSWTPSLATVPGPHLLDLPALWSQLSAHQPGAPSTVSRETGARLAELWDLLGPAEYLMGIGGDVRLKLEPETGLNQYGCSSRPRPWAVTFASSTASSISERGYAGAERGRRRSLSRALESGLEASRRAHAADVRRALVELYGLPDGARIVLTPSGTDGELCALAVAILGAPATPLTNVLMASEETGAGVPLATRGRHFGTLTARGVSVPQGEVIDGFPTDVELLAVRARSEDGGVRPADEVQEECARRVATAVASGRRVLLHLMDQSKTGLVCLADLDRIDAPRESLDVLVDACQGRLGAEAVRGYLRRGFMVLLTGSKFFTGPPFSGALVLPAAVARRLEAADPGLPRGLAQYFGRFDWPESAPACAALAADANVGLGLRWEAALAEMQAFSAVDRGTTKEILELFARRVGGAIRSNPDLVLHEAPPLRRPDAREGWDFTPTIFPFSILARSEARRPLGPDDAKRVYFWLNSDLTSCLGVGATGADRRLASRQFHIGQPVTMLGPAGVPTGALRLSAGARLVSGEPSQASLEASERLEREIGDALAALEKISLIMAHWDAVRAADPRPRYRSAELEDEPPSASSW
jgi:hypothetical protein